MIGLKRAFNATILNKNIIFEPQYTLSERAGSTSEAVRMQSQWHKNGFHNFFASFCSSYSLQRTDVSCDIYQL